MRRESADWKGNNGGLVKKVQGEQEQIKISVIVPVYNVETYLARCVQSLCRQTYTNLEMILVDDGSTDHSGSLCDLLAAGDDRIRVIHKQNGGLSDARNKGIESAQGDYLAFLDGDDWYDPVMLELLLKLCAEHDAEIAECSYRSICRDVVRAETSCSGFIKEFTPAEAIESNLDWQYCKPVAWNKLYRRDVIGEIRYPVGRLHEDEFTTHLFYLAARKIIYIDMALVNYERRNSESITARFHPRNMDACEAFREKMHLIWSRPELQGLNRKICNNYCYVLTDRAARCEASYPDCEELTEAIRHAYEDFEGLKEHGLDKSYIVKLEALFRKYHEVLER
jgi:glycosyltransferase involved in cell wall biosynthesis